MIVVATKAGLFSKSRRDMIWRIMEDMRYNCRVSTNPEPYRVALFWLDIADRTWGWRAD